MFCCVSRMRPDVCGVGSVLTDLPQFLASRMSEFLVSISLILFSAVCRVGSVPHNFPGFLQVL